MAYDFSISSAVQPNGRTVYYAKLNGSPSPKFIIGYRTLYLDNFGLYNTTVNTNQVYVPDDYKGTHGFWAHFIFPTARAESRGSFYCLNTYDRAKFTFSFMQYAAHVPNGDFVLFFRKLLALPNAKEYFPKITLHNGHIHYQNENNTLTMLEDDVSTQRLMNYLNPTLADVENQELICSARMVHWAVNDPAHRKIQVDTAIAHFKNNMAAYHERFGLDNAPAKICQMICDIRHQGRGKNDRIANAIDTNGDYERAFRNLCTIGAVNYQTRINTVKNTIRELEDSGIFLKKYKASTNSFVNI